MAEEKNKIFIGLACYNLAVIIVWLCAYIFVDVWSNDAVD